MNNLIKFITHKDIVLYIPHRQTSSIAQNKENRKYFIFIQYGWLFKLLYLKGSRFGELLLYLSLKIINPKYILSINWITRKEQLFNLWCKKHRPSQFIVVQHGIYYGGIVTDINHKFMHCDQFLVWSKYFKETFESFNPNRKKDIIVFGNPVYNNISRNKFNYPERCSKLLIAFSYLSDNDLYIYSPVIDGSIVKTATVHIKYHNKQKIKFAHKNLIEVNGSISSILSDYDTVIADHSTALTDAIFFKKNIIYAKHGTFPTVYEQFLVNQFETLKHIDSTLDEMIDQQAQEKLFNHMVELKDNKLQNYLECQSY